MTEVLCGDCLKLLRKPVLIQHGVEVEFALTFLDPPFNQGKDYAFFDDELPPRAILAMAKRRTLRLIG